MKSLLNIFNNMVHKPTLLTSDTYIDRIRKFTLSGIVVLCPFGFIGGVYSVIIGTTNTQIALTLNGVIWMIAAIVYTFLYAYVRIHKEFPSWMADIVISTFATLIFVGYLSIDHQSFMTTITAINVFAIMLQTRNLRGHVILNVFMFLVWAYNTSIVPVASAPPLLLPIFTKDIEGLAFIFSGIGIMIYLMVMGGVHFQHKACMKAIRRANAARDMCATVTQRLIRYDTDSAKECLEEFRVNGLDDMEPETFGALVNLVGNLEKYRPHLPSYVLPSKDEEEMSPRHNDMFDFHRRGSSSKVSTDSHLSSSVTKSAPVSPIGHPAAIASSSSEVVPLNHTKDVSKAVISAHYIAEENVVSFFEEYEAAMNRFVNRIHVLAQPTHATIHTFVGDTVHVSWNTSRRTVQHQSKAALFLAWLQKDSGDENLRSYGAVSTGPARSFYAGDRHSMLLVQTEWEGRMWTLHGLAVRYSACVMCQGVHDATKAFVESRWVDVVVCGGGMVGAVGDKTLVRVYELLRERPSNNDEWMYTVEASTNID
eukprot:PhF_6_TR35370/c1_g2_i1/m.51368